MATDNIVRFLQTHYTDDTLAALIAHTEDGKLSFDSCCCLVGIPTADHALRGRTGATAANREPHYIDASRYIDLPMDDMEQHPVYLAEVEFRDLGEDDQERRERLLPLLYAERERRERETEQSSASILDASRELAVGSTARA
jgi:uncharacterized protein (DUF58 family)